MIFKKYDKFINLGIGAAVSLLILGGGGCGNFSIEKLPHAQSIRNIHFDPSISKDDYPVLVGSLQLIDSLPIVEMESSEMKRVMKLKDSSSSSIWEWLEARVQYIVAPAPSKKKRRGLEQMLNLGAIFYHECQTQGISCILDIPAFRKIDVRSPRVGVLQMGKDLFSPVQATMGHEKDSIVNRLRILSILFHEARHSDGNKDSPGNREDSSVGTRGFFHGKCPEGHYLQDRLACDFNLNGPYTVEGLWLESVLSSCKHCTPKSKEAIRLLIADARSRVLTTENVTEWDDSPEGVR